jgi:hypothetical protein
MWIGSFGQLPATPSPRASLHQRDAAGDAADAVCTVVVVLSAVLPDMLDGLPR